MCYSNILADHKLCVEDEQELVKEREKERLLIMPFSFYVPAPVTLNAVNFGNGSCPWDITFH